MDNFHNINSKTYIFKVLKIVEAFHKKEITGVDADNIAMRLNIAPKDLKLFYEYKYMNSNKIFQVLLSDIEDLLNPNFTYFEKLIFISYHLKNNTFSPKLLKEYAKKTNINSEDVKECYQFLSDYYTKMTKKENKNLNLKEIYKELYLHIMNLFLYTSAPIGLNFYYRAVETNFEQNEDLISYIENISDLKKIESQIDNFNKGYIEIFKNSVYSTHMELKNILKIEIGNTFTYTQELLNMFKERLENFKKIIGQEAVYCSKIANELTSFLKKNQDLNLAELGQNFIKGAGLGHMAAVALGPIGIPIAMMTMLFQGQSAEEKNQEILNQLFEEFDKSIKILYFIKLKEYYEQYYKFTENIVTQYIKNFKDVEEIAIRINKKNEYVDYLNKQIDFFRNDENQKNIRTELKIIQNVMKGE